MTRLLRWDILQRHLRGSTDAMNYEQIADRVGSSLQTIHQTEASAIKKMRLNGMLQLARCKTTPPEH